MWLISLVLSITSALFATLLQQWARRYIEMPQVPTSAAERARVRSVLFLDIQQNKVPLVVETVPTLLHISVFLFFAGIVIFFFTIHKAVAIAVTVSVGIFVAMYVTLTFLPYFGDVCPYRTPMSALFWYPWYTILSLGAYCRHWVLEQLHNWAVRSNDGQGQHMTPRQEKLVHWKNICKDTYDRHRRRLKDGFEESIIQRARARVDVDREALIRLFYQLAQANESGLLKFVAKIPGDKFVRTIMTPPIESGKIVLQEPLNVMRDYVVVKRAQGQKESEHTSGLLVWLTAIHHITKEFSVPNRIQGSERGRLLYDVRVNFADIPCMREMWTHIDTGIRVTSHSICALLAKYLLQDRRPSPGELRWLEDVLGMTKNEINNSLDQPDVLDHWTLKFFVCGIFPGDVNPPTWPTSSIAKTLATLMDAGTEYVFNDTIFIAKLSNLVHRLEGDPNANSAVAKLRELFPTFITTPPPTLPPVSPPPLPTLPPVSPPPPPTLPPVSPPPPLSVPAPTSTPAATHPANVLSRLLRAIFRALGLIHEPAPQPSSVPGVA